MKPPNSLPRSDTEHRQQVLRWFIGRQRSDWSAADERQFQAWLGADLQHRNDHDRWLAHWRWLDAMPPDAVRAMQGRLAHDKSLQCAAAPDDGLGADLVRSPVCPPTSRRALFRPAFTGAATLALAWTTGYFGWQHWQTQPVFAQAFNTERGQQLDVSLPDGSQIRLDTATQVQVNLTRQSRTVHLHAGQAVFTVTPDVTRPFHVLAGPARVTVVGTRFLVRHSPDLSQPGGVRVAVEQGLVRVVPVDPTGGAARGEVVELAAGQQLLVNTGGSVSAVLPVSRDGIAPWIHHRVSFVDTPLSHALAELERYGPTGLTVRNPAVAALRLTGTFDPLDAATLRRALPIALPVRLRDTGGSIEVVLVLKP